jgi:hypothetical protein
MHNLCVFRKLGSTKCRIGVFSLTARNTQRCRIYSVKETAKEPIHTSEANQESPEPKPLKETNVFVKYLGLCMELSKARLGLLVAVTTGASLCFVV